MFDQTFVDAGQKTKKPVTVVLSVFLQISILALLIFIPLVYTQGLPSAQLKSILTAPAPPAALPKPPVEMKTQHVTATRRFSATLVAPTVIPKRINKVQEIAAPPNVAIPGGTAEANSATDSVIRGVLSSVSVPSPPAPAKPQTTGRPVRVATGVAEANLIRKVMPVYPALAKSARVQGTVEFTAIISKEGTIENLQLVHGHPLLVQAAKNAVLQWRYRPTLLNGEPVEVVTDIVVHFMLAQ
jgi:protein TonB